MNPRRAGFAAPNGDGRSSRSRFYKRLIFSGTKRRYKMMVRSTAQSPGSHKAQVSKLRQIMVLAEERPAHAHKLLLMVEEMHRELSRETRVKSLFAAMVDVARVQRSTRRRLNATELRALIAK